MSEAGMAMEYGANGVRIARSVETRPPSAVAVNWYRGSAALLVLGCLLALAGCGSSADTFAPTPSGNYSNANLNGGYAFAFSGTDSSGFFTVAGSFQANGNGQITGGSEDLSTFSGAFTNVAITGSYSIGADGRGTAVLNSAVTPISISFVMLSNQRALVVRFDNFATASGTIDLQNATAFSAAALQGAFAFSVSGVDTLGNVFGSAGLFQADSSGNLTNGIQDYNDDGTLNTDIPMTGSWTVGAANGRGTLTLTTTVATLNFAFYVVDANHVKIVETDSSAILGGDAYRQQGPFSNGSLNGSFAYTLGGTSSIGAFVAGGIFNANGSGTVSGGVEDVNNNGTVLQNAALSGSYSLAASGRGTMSLTNSTGTSTFVVYPSIGGLLMLEMDNTIVSSGVALQQAGSNFSNSSAQGNYGINLSGAQLGFETDLAAQFAANGNGSLTGALDINSGGSLFQGLALTGTYSITSNGRGTMVLQSTEGTLNLTFYLVNGSQALLIEVDPTLPAAGQFASQQ